jgi:hypothetical protein
MKANGLFIDDIIAPEYARLRVYVDDFKKSINLYP